MKDVLWILSWTGKVSKIMDLMRSSWIIPCYVMTCITSLVILLLAHSFWKSSNDFSDMRPIKLNQFVVCEVQSSKEKVYAKEEFWNFSVIVLKGFPNNRVCSVIIFFKFLVLIESLKSSAPAWILDVRNSGALFPLKEMSAENNIWSGKPS